MAVALQLKFWDQDDVPAGYSEWGLFRGDREDLKLPDDTELQRLFQEATGLEGSRLIVRSRIALGVYLQMPIGIRKKKRLTFLDAVEATLSASETA